MRVRGGVRWLAFVCLAGGVCGGSVGCFRGVPHHCNAQVVGCDNDLPKELRLMSLPPYVVEPPDILLVNTMRVVPKPPYRLQPLDTLMVFVPEERALPGQPIRGAYPIDPDGTVNLGPDYGTVRVINRDGQGMTLDEAREAINAHLGGIIKNPNAHVMLGQSRGMQQIRGIHLVRPDGTIGLGLYGSVYIAGMTLNQAKQAIEDHLGRTLLKPEVSLDVYSYNSKWYYVIMDGAGYGQRMLRLPITGKETVLDAISMVYGLQPVSSKQHVWIARPSSIESCGQQILPVDWAAITECGSPETNYQVLPGDRIYVKGNPLITLNNRLTQFFAPMQTTMGAMLLGTSVTSSIESLRLINSSTGGNTLISPTGIR